MDTFNPILKPDEGMRMEVDPKVIEIQFGDGYMQDLGDGINNDLDKARPKWTNAKKAEADPIIAFLRPKAKTREPFLWVPNGETVARVFKVKTFSYAWKRGRYCDIEAEFEETATRL